MCTSLPAAGKKGLYIVDLKHVKPCDLGTDDSGAYSSHSCNTVPYRFPKAGEQPECLQRKRLSKSDVQTLQQQDKGDKIVYVKRHYSYRLEHSSHARQIIKCEDALTGTPGPYSIIQYTDDFSFPMPHGNSRSTEPYIRTKPSVLKQAKSMGEKMSAKHVIHSIDKKNGGSTKMKSPSDVIRNRQPLYNAFRYIEGKQKTRGPTKQIDFGKLVCLMSQNKFLIDVSFTQKKEDIYPKTFAVHDSALV